MSRTFKDRPYWVRVRDPYEQTHTKHTVHDGPCDIDVFDSQDFHGPVYNTGGCVRRIHAYLRPWCSWEPWNFTLGPDMWSRNPDRARKRDALINARKLYAATGEVDDFDFPNERAVKCHPWWRWD